MPLPPKRKQGYQKRLLLKRLYGRRRRIEKRLKTTLQITEEKQASREEILRIAADYIKSMRRKTTAHQRDINDLKQQNKILEEQIRSLEKAKSSGNFASVAAVLETIHIANNKRGAMTGYDRESESDESSENFHKSKD